MSSPVLDPDDSPETTTGPSRRGARVWFGVAIVVYLAASTILLVRPLHWLLGVVSDDAFYYLQVARRLADTGSSSFDGTNPTNGYHPLWMLVCTLCASFVHDRESLLRCVLSVGFAAHLLASFLLARGLRRVVGEAWSWIGGALWLLNPLPLILLMQGVEAPVYLLALVVVLHVYWTRIDGFLAAGSGPPTRIPTRNALMLGAALGLAFLARTEAIVGACVTTALITVGTYRRGRSLAGAARVLASVGGAAAVVATPWLAFSWWAVGSVWQDSGSMKMLWASGAAGQGVPIDLAYLGNFMSGFWLTTPIGMLLLGRGSDLLAGALLTGIAIFAWVDRGQPGIGPHRRTSVGILATLLGTGLVYGAILGEMQIWHLAQPGLGWFVLCFVWLVRAGNAAHARPSVGRRLVRRGFGVYATLALALLLHLKTSVLMKERYPWQRDVYASQPAFEALVPAHESIGSFNAGIPGYFGRRTVINLDGLVNHSVIPYWKARHFDRFLVDQRIGYVLDERASLARAKSYSISPITALTPVRSEKLTGWFAGDRYLWRVTPVSP